MLVLKTRLKNSNYNLDEYDTVFPATPVWAWHPTPAINTFVSKANLTNKNVYLIGVAAGENLSKTMDILKRKVIGMSTYVGIDPVKKNLSEKEAALKDYGKN